jgi:cell division transport system permease protein
MSAIPEVVAKRSEPKPAAEPTSAQLKRNMPLVPAESIAGRALVTVIAIMTFLASLTAGGAVLIASASQDWRSALSREMTIQIRPGPARDLDVEARKAADIARAVQGIADVRIFTKEESGRLLEPWLGSGLDLGELPVPRMIVVQLAPGAVPDLAKLREALERIPGASLDDHHLWLERLAAMANTIVVAAIVIFVLVLVAMALAVAFATRGAMAGNRGIVDVLHFVGAEDRFIAGQFQRHFLRLGLRGGIVGGGAAILVFITAGLVSQWWLATPSGDQIEALFGSFSLGAKGYAAILVIAAAIAILTGMMSRSIVFRHLRGLD